MALTPCHECGSQVSTEATACPRCGAPVRRPQAAQEQSQLSIPSLSAAIATVLAFVTAKLIPALPFWAFLIIFLTTWAGAYLALRRRGGNLWTINRD